MQDRSDCLDQEACQEISELFRRYPTPRDARCPKIPIVSICRTIVGLLKRK